MMETLLMHIFITALVKELFYMCILHKEHKVHATKHLYNKRQIHI